MNFLRSSANRHFSLAALTIQVILIALVTVTPWFFGGVEPWVQVWLFLPAAAALLLWLIHQFTPGEASAPLPLAILPLLAAILLAGLHLLPLDHKLLHWLSPSSAALWEELLPAAVASGPATSAPGDTPRTSPISLYPASTRHDLSLLLLATTVFILGAQFFNSERSILWLAATLAAVGTGMAFFGLVQQLTYNGQIYWTFERTRGGTPFGPYVSRNNAAGYLNLCLAGALGVLVWLTSGRAGRYAYDDLQPPRSFLRRLGDGIVEMTANLTATKLAALAAVGFIVTGILSSLSRGGFLSAVGAAGFTVVCLLLALRRRSQAMVVAVAAVMSVGLLIWVDRTEAVQARLGTLVDGQALEDGRLYHWEESLQAVPDFWRLGSGIGSYRYIYGMYQQRDLEGWFYYAENQYIQALVEGGVAGLGLLLSMIALMAAACFYLFRAGRKTGNYAPAVVGTFALTSQMIGGMFDFGLYLSANMMLMALLCGAVTGRAAWIKTRAETAKLGLPFALPPIPLLKPILVLALLAGLVFGHSELRGLAAVDLAIQNARNDPINHETDTQTVPLLIAELTSAADQRPDDAEVHRRLAALHLQLYQLHAFADLRRQYGEAADPEQLWALANPALLHHWFHWLRQTQAEDQLQQLLAQSAVSTTLGPAYHHLILSRAACPLLPRVHASLAEICSLAPGATETNETEHIARAIRLAPGDPALLFYCGLLDFQAGRMDQACERWRGSLAVSPRYEKEIIDRAAQRLTPERMVDQLLPDSPELLVRIVRRYYAGDDAKAARQVFLARAAALLDDGIGLPADERHYWRATVHVLSGQYPEAIENFGRAVQLRPAEVAWRYEYAQLLTQQCLWDEAHVQARHLARSAPNNRRYRRLLETVHDGRLRQSSGEW